MVNETTSLNECKLCHKPIRVMAQQNTGFCCQLHQKQWESKMATIQPIPQEAVEALREHEAEQRQVATEMWQQVEANAKRTPEMVLADVEALAQRWREQMMSLWPKPLYMNELQRIAYGLVRELEFVLHPNEEGEDGDG